MDRIRAVVLVALLGLVLLLMPLVLSVPSAPASEAYAADLPIVKAHGGVALLASGGPDAFGYTHVDSNEPCGAPTFAFIDISGTGTNLGAGDETTHGPFGLGLTFNFYGVDYTQLWISSNGWVSFSDPAGNTDFTNDCPLPNTNGVENFITGVWDDLNPSEAGAVYRQAFGAGSCPYGSYPGACFIAMWNGVEFFDPVEGTTTFEIILFDNNEILVQISSPGPANATPTTGIENADASIGLTYDCSLISNPLPNNRAILFAPPFVVNTTNDVDDGTCDTTHCSLREAINAANAITGTSTINFDISGCPGGVCTIQPGPALPVITNTVTISGYSQTGALPATDMTPAILKIVLDGSSAGNGVNGLELKTDCSTVRGLNIHGFRVTDVGINDTEGNGIVIRQGMTNTIAGNFIGTNVAGTACVGNGGSGVLIGGGFDSTAGADRNTIGGTDPADRNLITCNGFQSNTVTDGDGVTIWANSFVVVDAGGHIIGGTFYSADNNTVVGNYIGTDVNGTAVPLIGTDTLGLDHFGNTGAGVRIAGGQANTVGGTTVDKRNILSGNELDGVRIEDVVYNDPPTLMRGANSNIVQGNYIGTDVAGTGDLGNLNAGVHIIGFVDDADNNLIGGTTGTTPGGACTGACNLISGNGASGVMILGGEADHNTVQGNYIGTNPAGVTAIPNDGNGIVITDAEDNTIGGTTDTARNLVSGNGAHGVSIVNGPKTWVPLPGATGDVFRVWGDGEASGNNIQGNYIGTAVSGTAALANTLSGVLIMDAAGNTVGGATPGERNIISGNGQNGVLFMMASPPGNTETDVVTAEGTASGNLVSGSDSATVTITDQPGAIQVTKTADPTNVAAVGDVVTFTIRITNTSGVEVMIKRLSDSFHGNLNGQGTCAVPQTLASGGFYTCTFSAPVYGVGGNNTETDTVTVSGTDENGNFVIDSDSATVTIGDPPPIRVTKTAYPTGLAPPGGTVNFTVTVENISLATVTITRTWDTKHGILCGMPPAVVVLGPGDTLQCLYSATVSGATGNTVEGNYIGTDVTGTAALPNQAAGVVITSPDNTIGGATAAQGNLISGNVREGVILLGANATGNSLRHNLIGTRADGASVLGNGFHGVLLDPAPSDNAIGSSVGMGNTIAHNGRDGVFVVSGTGNRILSNSIFTNAELGIDVGGNGVTANDDGDPDGGANTLQNYPVLTSASWSGGLTSIQGVLNSRPNTQFTIQFFYSPTCDPSGFGEGQTYLGSVSVGTNASGDATISVSFASDLTGNFITATATDPYNNTSEFSNCIPVPSAPALTINKQVQDLNGGSAKPGDVLRYTIHYANIGNAPATGVAITDTYSTFCVTRTNVTNGGFPNHDDNGTRLRWPATGGILLAAGTSGSVRYDCTLQPSFPAGTHYVTNTSTIDSDETDPDCTGETPPDEDPEDGCDQEQVTVTIAPVLTINKECTPAAGNIPGDTVHCVIQYANTGDAAATGATIVDDYDQSKGSVSSITGSAHFAVGTDNTDTIMWGPSTIPVGESGQVEYDYDLAGPSAFPDGTTPVTNTATIDSNETTPVQDPETIQVTVRRELTINKQGQDLNGGSAEPGDILRYTINYANTGNVQVTGVFITDDYSHLCASISNVTTDANFPTYSDSAGVLRWPAAGGVLLAAGASGSLRYDCTLQASFPPGTLQVTNISTIVSAETGPEQDTVRLSTGCYDFNGNGVVDAGDVEEVTIRWRMTENDPGWDARYDLNEDGCITVVDIYLVAAQWSQTCP